MPESVNALSLASTEVRLGDPLRVVGHRLDLETLFIPTREPFAGLKQAVTLCDV